jgi:hypothetical protein
MPDKLIGEADLRAIAAAELRRTRRAGPMFAKGAILPEFSRRLATWELLWLVMLSDGEARSIKEIIDQIETRTMTRRSLYTFFDEQVVRRNILFEKTGVAKRRVQVCDQLRREIEDFAGFVLSDGRNGAEGRENGEHGAKGAPTEPYAPQDLSP